MSAEHGYIYCLINPGFPSLVKIGATTKDPLERARELSAPTSTPLPFVLAYHRAVKFPFEVEANLHRILADHRTNDSREFFSIPLYKVIELLEKYEEDLSGVYHCIETPWADLFDTFPDDGAGRELTEDERVKCTDLAVRLARSSVSETDE